MNNLKNYENNKTMKFLIFALSLITLFYYFGYPLKIIIGIEFSIIEELSLFFTIIHFLLSFLLIVSFLLFKFDLPLFVRIIAFLSLSIQLVILNFGSIIHLTD